MAPCPNGAISHNASRLKMKTNETILGRVDVMEIRRSAGKIGATQEIFANHARGIGGSTAGDRGEDSGNRDGGRHLDHQHATGIPVKTLRNWEQRRRKPTGAALTLLLLIQKNPSLVIETMNSSA
jgi:hypothetical protein